MKKLLFSMSLLAAAAAAHAQITLNQSDYASANLFGPDTLLVSNATLVGVPSLSGFASGTNADLSSFTSANNVSINYRVAGTGSNQWADSESLSFGSYIGYKANYESQLLSTGYVQTGIHIRRSAVGLLSAGLAGAVSTDSIVVNGQDIVFSSTREKLKFPVTYPTAPWVSSYNFNLGFSITYALGSYINTQGQVRSYVTENDAVTGYGTVQVRTKDGSLSNYIPVLQVTSTVSTRDSFFIGGVAMTPQQLALFQGVNGQFTTQGQTTVSHEIFYYRKGELTPALHVTFDNANTKPMSAESQGSRMPEYVPEVPSVNTLAVYPNPVTNHTIIITGAPANYGNWSYQLENVAGQVITKGALQLNANNTKTSISLSNKVAPGTYFLHMYNNAAQETVKTLTIK